jgi:hypothetical protein
MKCILEKPPLKHKSIRLVPLGSERMRRQNKKWVGKRTFFRLVNRVCSYENGLEIPQETQTPHDAKI